MCQDCIKFLTDAQKEAKENSSFVTTLIANIENQCDLLGPGLSDMVRTPHEWWSKYFSLLKKNFSENSVYSPAMFGFCFFVFFSVSLAVQAVRQPVW